MQNMDNGNGTFFYAIENKIIPEWPATYIAMFVTRNEWERCRHFTDLKHLRFKPFNKLHGAARTVLGDIITYCHQIDLSLIGKNDFHDFRRRSSVSA